MMPRLRGYLVMAGKQATPQSVVARDVTMRAWNPYRRLKPRRGQLPDTGLVVGRNNSILHIRCSEESEEEAHGGFRALLKHSGVVVVAATEAALAKPTISLAVRHACVQAVEVARDGGRAVLGVCLTLPGAAAPSPADGQIFAQQLADGLGVEVIATNTTVAVAPPNALFSGTDRPGHGWYRFQRGRPAEWIGHRYPAPGWEQLLPRTDLAGGELSLVPIPAGLAVRRSDELMPEALRVPVHPGRPRLVLGHPADGELSSLAVAEFLRKASPQFRECVQLVPTDLQTSSARWNQRLAEQLGHAVVVSTGMVSDDGAGGTITAVRDVSGEPTWEPPAIALRYSPDGPTEVVEVAPPPQGWLVFDALQYRQAPPPGAGVAVPGGWVARVVPSGLALLPIGQESGDVDAMPFEPNRMTLTVVCTQQCEVSPMPTLRSLLDSLPLSSRERLRLVAVQSVPPDLVAEIRDLARLYGAEFENGASASTPTRPPVEAPDEQETRVVKPVSPCLEAVEPVAEKTRILPVPSGPGAVLVPVPRTPAVLGGVIDCSAAERSEFAHWSGNRLEAAEFADEVESADARIDYAAVRLYLGSGEWSGAALNSALRGSGEDVPHHYVACLAAGLRRLPSHCGVVFLRVTDRAGLAAAYSVGDVLTEPGFLSALAARPRESGEERCAEVVIWSRTARRTAAVNPPDPADEVVFPAGSRFKVLGIDRTIGGSGGLAVFLAELPPNPSEASSESDSDRVLLDELRGALRRGRCGDPVEPTEAQAERCDVPVGLVMRCGEEVNHVHR
ncbi:hypothetical protein ABT324_02655 [Saccharopolyspora sp. NPDC000359]|uniref:hypothetical protein n=1 Tax=Saccharopolyspora sp. NPDC000359 TaxID=3154251 RepID=UPI00332C7ACA